jgi:hypothetical protein
LQSTTSVSETVTQICSARDHILNEIDLIIWKQ